jgi:hypothetical protein
VAQDVGPEYHQKKYIFKTDYKSVCMHGRNLILYLKEYTKILMNEYLTGLGHFIFATYIYIYVYIYVYIYIYK